jgi:2-polyprenyl-3-methyl-5-hydroxy-6-metoxy-1,4-benzoquinol methylase
MTRLAQKNINTPEEYDRIYRLRAEKVPDSQDLRRWRKLLRYYRGGNLVDLGCLDSLIIPMANENPKHGYLHGFDQTPEAIEDMAKKYRYAYFNTGDLYETGYGTGMWDYVVAGEVIEHLDDPQRFIHEAMRLVKSGGVFALSTPLNETEAGEVDKERHLWSYSRQDIHNLLEPYGEVVTTRLGSEWFPYKYHFPTVIGYCFKA